MKITRGIRFLPMGSTYDKMNSPVGDLTIITSSQGLHAIFWDTDRQNPQCEKIINNLNQSQTKKQLYDQKTTD